MTRGAPIETDTPREIARAGTTSDGRARLEDQLRRAIKFAVWSLVVAWGLSSLWYPFGWDQGIFAWVGDTILRGGMPFRDAFDLKGPAAHAVFALAQSVFGRNQWGIRVVDLLGIAAAAWLVSQVVSRYTTRGAGPWAAALLILWYGGLTFWHTAQPDGFAAVAFCLGFLPLLHSDRRPTWLAAAGAGLAVGFATAIKPNYAIFLLVPAVVLLGRFAERRAQGYARLAVTVLASLVVVGAFVLWFMMRGALADLIEVHIAYNASTYSGGYLSIGPRLEGLFTYVLTGKVFVIALPAAVVGAWTLYRRDRLAAVAVVTWAALAVATVVLQNKFFDYQWAPLFAPVVILVAVGLHGALAPRDDQPASRALALVMFLAIAMHTAIQPAFEVANWASYMVGLRDKAAYYDTFGVPGNDLRMSEHIREAAQPGDGLLVMAWNAEILYTTGLESVSRFGYSLPFWMGEGTEYQARYRQEVMQDLEERPPEFVVVATQAVPLVGRVVALDEFPEFARFLDARYTEDVTFGDLVLYRLR